MNVESTQSGCTGGGLGAALRGAAGFGGVSVVVYGTVAFGGRWLYRTLGEGGAYAFWAALYLLGAPWLLGRLLVEAGRRRLFMGWFILGFLAYAAGWIAAYFPLRHKPGEVLASVAGPALMGWVLAWGLNRGRAPGSVLLALVVGHAAGYFAGDAFHALVGGPVGMVGWGVFHGAGFGAAIGWAVARLERGRTADVPSGGGG